MFNVGKLCRWLACALLASGLMGASQAQSWPTRPVRIVVSFPPGTPGDVIARLIQPDLQSAWGQPVVVENKPGATGNIGAAEVARATDEHTLLVGPDTIVTINPHLYRKLNFKPRQDLQFISYLASFNQMLACYPGAKIRTLADFLKQELNTSYASGGAGSPSQMAMELLLSAGHTRMSNIPYRGPTPAVQDVLAGQVTCGFLPSSIVTPHVKSGRLTALAVSGLERSVGLPGVPTVAESGFPGFDATFFETMMAPATLSPALIDRIQRDVRQALNQPSVKKQLLEMDLRVVASTPKEAAARSGVDHEKWGKVAREINLLLD